MGIKSYKTGKKFEEELCWWFRYNGYYPEYHEKSISGSQSSDITIIKDNIATKVECKNLENKNGIFNLNRIEENQWLSYKVFKECGNKNMILAIKNNDNIYFIDFCILDYYKTSIPLKEIKPNITNWQETIDKIMKE